MIRISQLDPNPIKEFLKWYHLAEQAKIKYPESMALATSTREGIPSVRIVLYKGMNSNGLRFFTNYQSQKGKELENNPKASVVFYWPKLDRQIRVYGKVKKLSKQESDEYWNSRPRLSRIHALASDQSHIVRQKEILEQKVQHFSKLYPSDVIPRPSYWGGYCLIPERFEFWIAGDYRLHDRFLYVKRSGRWKKYTLSP